MREDQIKFLKTIVLNRKLELLKFKKETGGSNMDETFIKECDLIIEELEKLLKKN